MASCGRHGAVWRGSVWLVRARYGAFGHGRRGKVRMGMERCVVVGLGAVW